MAEEPSRKKRHVALPTLKLKLIEAIKSHEIIISEADVENVEYKNAWKSIYEKLPNKEDGYYERLWQNLRRNYNAVKKNPGQNTNRDIFKAMKKLMEPPKEKKPGNLAGPRRSDAEPRPSTSFAQREQPTGTQTRSSTASKKDDNDAICHKIFSLLMTVPPADKARLRDRLMGVLLILKPEIESRVDRYGMKEMFNERNIDDMDWSGLDIDRDVCKAAWHFISKKRACLNSNS